MDFQTLHKTIPYVKDGKLHEQTTEVDAGLGWKIWVQQPGKYAPKTEGGDFVVVVTDNRGGWKAKKFKHDDLFDDIELKVGADHIYMQREFAPALAHVIYSRQDVRSVHTLMTPADLPGLRIISLLRASQALALAEHRRYAQHEATGGGRFLPARFALGIIFGKWTANEAKLVQYNGKPGLQKLESFYGKTPTLKELANV